MASDDKIFLRIEVAAQRLSLGRSKVYELVRTGVIPSTHFGRSVRIHAGALEAWANEQATTAVAPESDPSALDPRPRP